MSRHARRVSFVCLFVFLVFVLSALVSMKKETHLNTHIAGLQHINRKNLVDLSQISLLVFAEKPKSLTYFLLANSF